MTGGLPKCVAIELRSSACVEDFCDFGPAGSVWIGDVDECEQELALSRVIPGDWHDG